MSNQSSGEVRKTWVQLTVSMEPRLVEMPHLQEPHQALKKVLIDIDALGVDQAEQRATVQETTQVLRQKMDEGKALALRLRAGLTSLYGNRAERLIEFGIRPLRRRTSPAEKPPVIGGSQAEPNRESK